ncbi:TetR/AcrR family transcriptional regulator [Promicromonospora sp. MS192]|uniref:TetR/AcrR family transcriptional regulator n=1 Tax=Promicromonospora sp. MS192 TaxID=3412684 RepID=UPI003C2B316F
MDAASASCAECGTGLGPAAGTGRPRRYCSRSCQSRAYRRRRDEGRRTAVPRTRSGAPGVGRRAGGGAAGAGLVDVAVVLADAEGIGAVTLRSVAHRAGTAPGEVRRVFANRERLVEAMVQRLLAGPHGGEPPPQGTPVRVLAGLAETEWQAYRRHPWLVSVLASSRPPLVPAVLDAARASVDAFVALGLDPPTALARYVALSGYVQGMALLLLTERDEAARSGTAYPAWWVQEVRRLDRTGARRRHPWLDDVSGGVLPAAFATDVDAWFRDGLDRVLAGLAGGDGAASA